MDVSERNGLYRNSNPALPLPQSELLSITPPSLPNTTFTYFNSKTVRPNCQVVGLNTCCQGTNGREVFRTISMKIFISKPKETASQQSVVIEVEMLGHTTDNTTDLYFDVAENLEIYSWSTWPVVVAIENAWPNSRVINMQEEFWREKLSVTTQLTNLPSNKRRNWFNIMPLLMSMEIMSQRRNNELFSYLNSKKHFWRSKKILLLQKNTHATKNIFIQQKKYS